jgi:hypothetical protein
MPLHGSSILLVCNAYGYANRTVHVRPLQLISIKLLYICVPFLCMLCVFVHDPGANTDAPGLSKWGADRVASKPSLIVGWSPRIRSCIIMIIIVIITTLSIIIKRTNFPYCYFSFGLQKFSDPCCKIFAANGGQLGSFGLPDCQRIPTAPLGDTPAPWLHWASYVLWMWVPGGWCA